jgi:hypothetical protein
MASIGKGLLSGHISTRADRGDGGAFGAMMEMKKIDVAAIAAAAGWAHRCVPLRRTCSSLAQIAILWVPLKLRLSPPAPDD